MSPSLLDSRSLAFAAQPLTQAAICLALATIFGAAAIPKLRNPRHFTMTVVEYRVLPWRASRMYAAALPPLELLIAVALVTGTAIGLAALAAVIALCSFILGVGVNLARGRRVDCGCFGASHKRSVGPVLLIQDLLLLIFALYVLASSSSLAGMASWSVWRILPTDAKLPGIGLSLIVALTVTVALRPRSPRLRSRPAAAASSAASREEGERVSHRQPLLLVTSSRESWFRKEGGSV